MLEGSEDAALERKGGWLVDEEEREVSGCGVGTG